MKENIRKEKWINKIISEKKKRSQLLKALLTTFVILAASLPSEPWNWVSLDPHPTVIGLPKIQSEIKSHRQLK